MLRTLRRRRAFWTRALTLAALLALALRALTPAGYMLSPQTGGGLVVTLCGGGGLQARLDAATGEVDLQPAHTPSEKPSHPDAPCAFASMAPLAAPAEAPPLGAPHTASTWAPVAAAPAPGRGLAAPPPWSTGPPLLT